MVFLELLDAYSFIFMYYRRFLAKFLFRRGYAFLEVLSNFFEERVLCLFSSMEASICLHLSLDSGFIFLEHNIPQFLFYNSLFLFVANFGSYFCGLS